MRRVVESRKSGMWESLGRLSIFSTNPRLLRTKSHHNNRHRCGSYAAPARIHTSQPTSRSDGSAVPQSLFPLFINTVQKSFCNFCYKPLTDRHTCLIMAYHTWSLCQPLCASLAKYVLNMTFLSSCFFPRCTGRDALTTL